MKDNDPLKPEYTPDGISFRLTKKFTFEPNEELPYPVVEQSLAQLNDSGTENKHVPHIMVLYGTLSRRAPTIYIYIYRCLC